MTKKTESKALTPVDALKQTLSKMSFKDALPAHVTEEKFKRVLATAVSQTPALVKADRMSLFAAAMKCAQEGLLPDGREAALVTYGNTVQYMPMIAGILKKVRNSGELASITAMIVHKNDKFRYWVDADGEQILHEPLMFGDRGDAIGTYALAKTKDGGIYIEVMTLDQIEAVKSVSKSKDKGPWGGKFKHEMWKKTALRRLSKRLPMSTDLELTMHSDDDMYDVNKEPAPVEATVAPAETKPSRLKGMIQPQAPAEAPDPNPGVGFEEPVIDEPRPPTQEEPPAPELPL